MLRPFILFFIIAGIFITENSFCQGSPSFLPGIHIIEKKSHLIFEPYIINLTKDNIHHLSYDFTVKKTGSSGTSSNKQSGRFSIAPEDSLNLSKVRIQSFPGDKYTSHFRLFEKNKLINEKIKEFTSPVNNLNQ